LNGKPRVGPEERKGPRIAGPTQGEKKGTHSAPKKANRALWWPFVDMAIYWAPQNSVKTERPIQQEKKGKGRAGNGTLASSIGPAPEK